LKTWSKMRAARPLGLCRQKRAPCCACCKLTLASRHTHRTNDAQPTLCVCVPGSQKCGVNCVLLVHRGCAGKKEHRAVCAVNWWCHRCPHTGRMAHNA
jgi:hypothetical protein